MKTIILFIRAMRPQQFLLKNGFVFAALIFAKRFVEGADGARTIAWHSILQVFLAYIAFCAASGVIYVINDLRDYAADRNHPTKKNRPIASGKLGKPIALALGLVVVILAFAESYLITPGFAAVLLIYFLLNLAYSVALKHIVLVDVITIASGFLLRVIGGAVALSPAPQISPWLIICTFLLALFLGFSKRRRELVLLGDTAEEHRKILTEYSPYFLDQIIGIVTSATLISYILYTRDPGVSQFLGTPVWHGFQSLLLTVPFVLYGIFRYLYLVHLKEGGGSPARALLTDPPLLIAVIGWVATIVVLILLSN
jgi:4-hydroxybenzoate polyprenyltransferase